MPYLLTAGLAGCVGILNVKTRNSRSGRMAMASTGPVMGGAGAATSPANLRAKARRLVEAVPLPDDLPPVQDGPGRRIDHAAELRSLSNRWHNCPCNYIDKVDQGDAAAYLWEEKRLMAVCLVERRGCLSWLLRDTKGPRNIEVDPSAFGAPSTRL